MGFRRAGRKEENTQKRPREAPFRQPCVSERRARGTILLPQLAVGSPRHPDGAQPALPGERRRLRPAEEGGRRGAVHLPPETREASGVSAVLRAGRAQGKRRKEKSGGVPRGAPHLGGCAAVTTGPKSSRLGGEGGPEGGREGGKEGGGTGGPPPPPSSRAAAGPRRDHSVPVPAPRAGARPRADCVI